VDESRAGDAGSLTELWVGRQVVIQHLAGTSGGKQPVAKKEEMLLATYNALGVEAQRSAEEAPLFMPWSANLSIQGPSREDMKWERRDRQELMDRLAGAGSESEEDAKAAADSWLSAHPGDGDVRLAREQLEAHSAEDLEEGSPT
jgi:hypothetical protein